MVSGCDKYMQIVRCFRDEDPRADRQAEFTQLDVEMRFIDRENIISIMEGLLRRIWKEILGKEIPNPIPHMEYDEAMSQYGSDRPDLRFGMKLHDITDLGQQTDFGVFKNAAMVKAIVVPGGGKLSRKETDALAEWAKGFGAKGLAVTKVTASGARHRRCQIPRSDRREAHRANRRQGRRSALLRRRQAENRSQGSRRASFEDGPRSETRRLHPNSPGCGWSISPRSNSTMKKSDTLPRIIRSRFRWTATCPSSTAAIRRRSNRSRAKHTTSSATAAKSAADRSVFIAWTFSKRSFALLGIDEAAQKAKFGFLLDALNYGAPPHGGIALGLDRLIMILRGITNIRDVIAFPKTQSGADLMCGSPSAIDEKQLREANIRVVLPMGKTDALKA